MTTFEHHEVTRWQQDAMTISAASLVAAFFRSANLTDEVAQATLLARYPDLEGLALASENELAHIPGVGSARAELMTWALAFAVRALRNQRIPRGTIVSSEDLGEFLIGRFAGKVAEEFVVYYLNVKNQVLGEFVESRGAFDASLVDHRVILRRALLLGATRLIVGHNHPSGDVTPSSNDEDVTLRLHMNAQMMGIDLLDHLIIGRDDYRSFREEGLL